MFRVTHKGCGAVAFYVDIDCDLSELWTRDMDSSTAILPNGTRPVNGEKVRCGHCGAPLYGEFHFETVQDDDPDWLSIIALKLMADRGKE